MKTKKPSISYIRFEKKIHARITVFELAMNWDIYFILPLNQRLSLSYDL